MVTKMTSKNQVTIPRKILERAGLSSLKEDEKYFEVDVKNNLILLKPVTLVIEERIPEEQWQKFEKWAVRVDKGDEVFDSSAQAAQFFKKRMKKK
mgnify:FL=1